jgi:hypothetical protein
MARPVLPTLVVPVVHPLPSLDACLAALARTLPAGAAVRLVDDGGGDPRVGAMARDWCAQAQGLDARYRRQDRPRGELAAVQAVLDDTDDASAAGDLVVLASDAVPAGPWLAQLAAMAAREPRAGSLVPWSNRDELASFPDARAPNALPGAADADAIAEAAAALDDAPLQDLPPAAGACLYLRRDALRAVGGLDGATFRGMRGLDDLCRRASALGWRHGLCPRAWVGRQDDALARDPAAAEDLPRLLARWPDHQERIARCFLDDPLRALRERLREAIARRAAGGPQRDLFA